jgi:chemotaxis response regulator CheB
MSLIRVFIVSDSLTFSDGLKNLLVSEPEVEIIGEEMDVNQAIDQIYSLKPDVVIWGNTGMRQEAAQEEARLLKATPGTRFIGLTLQNNKIVVYQSFQKIVQGVQDLVEAVTCKFIPTRANELSRLDFSQSVLLVGWVWLLDSFIAFVV